MPVPKKRSASWRAPPPRRRRWQWRCGLAVGECEKATPPRKGGHLTSFVPPICSTFSFGPSSSPPSPGFPECFVWLGLVCGSIRCVEFLRFIVWVLPWGKSSNVIVKVLYLACHMLRLRLRLRLLFRDRIRWWDSVSSSCSFRDSMIESRRSHDLLHDRSTPPPPPPPHPTMLSSFISNLSMRGKV